MLDAALRMHSAIEVGDTLTFTSSAARSTSRARARRSYPASPIPPSQPGLAWFAPATLDGQPDRTLALDGGASTSAIRPRLRRSPSGGTTAPSRDACFETWQDQRDTRWPMQPMQVIVTTVHHPAPDRRFRRRRVLVEPAQRPTPRDRLPEGGPASRPRQVGAVLRFESTPLASSPRPSASRSERLSRPARRALRRNADRLTNDRGDPWHILVAELRRPSLLLSPEP